jgi:hypothetical protein
MNLLRVDLHCWIALLSSYCRSGIPPTPAPNLLGHNGLLRGDEIFSRIRAKDVTWDHANAKRSKFLHIGQSTQPGKAAEEVAFQFGPSHLGPPLYPFGPTPFGPFNWALPIWALHSGPSRLGPSCFGPSWLGPWLLVTLLSVSISEHLT